MISEQFLELQGYLQEFKNQGADIQRRADGSYLITIKGVDLPAGWNPRKVDIFFVAPPGYPAAKPDCFWVSPPVRLSNGAIPQSANEGTPLPYDLTPGRPLTWFSWHLQVWDPNRSRLENFYRAIVQRLNPPR
jgi:Prokaryotic E2 family E